MTESTLIFNQPSFTEQVRDIQTYITDYVMHSEPQLADRIIESISSQGELLSVIVEAVAAYTIENARKMNKEADELSRLTVKTTNGIDRLVANTGLTRGVLVAGENGDPDVMESNASLLTRFDLSHYQANTTGTRYGYKFHGLCYGTNEKPSISVVKEGNKIIQTYTFGESGGSNIADCEFRATESGSGKVVGAATPVFGETVDLDAWLVYMQRPDVAQETDVVSTKLATPRSYTVTVNAYTNNDPAHHVDQAELNRLCQLLVDSKRHNTARVSDHDFSYIAKSLGAYDVDIIGLDEPLICEWDEYPECAGVTCNVMGKRQS